MLSGGEKGWGGGNHAPGGRGGNRGLEAKTLTLPVNEGLLVRVVKPKLNYLFSSLESLNSRF